MERPYLYLFVRSDLSPQQQIIQTAHAVDEMSSGGKNYMVLCAARHEHDLMKISAELSYHNVKHHMFYEPDVNSYTAIATVPLKGTERVPLRKYKTM